MAYIKIFGQSVCKYIRDRASAGDSKLVITNTLSAHGITVNHHTLAINYSKGRNLTDVGAEPFDKVKSQKKVKEKITLTKLFGIFNKRIRPFFKLINKELPYEMRKVFIDKDFNFYLTQVDYDEIGRTFKKECPDLSLTIKEIKTILNSDEREDIRRKRRNFQRESSNENIFEEPTRLKLLDSKKYNDVMDKMFKSISKKQISIHGNKFTIEGSKETHGGTSKYTVHIGDLELYAYLKLSKTGGVVVKFSNY